MIACGPCGPQSEPSGFNALAIAALDAGREYAARNCYVASHFSILCRTAPGIAGDALALTHDAVRRALLSLRADGKDYALRGELADADALADVLEAVRREGAELKGKGKKTLSKALKAAAQAYVATVAMPILAREIEVALGTAEGWSLALDPDDKDQQTLLFVYPRTSGYGLAYGENYGGADESGYIKPRIKLEFGARGDTEPFALRPILPIWPKTFPRNCRIR